MFPSSDKRMEKYHTHGIVIILSYINYLIYFIYLSVIRMKGLIKDGRIYLSVDDFLNKEYVVAVGISHIQDYAPISFYLNFDKFRNLSVKFANSPHEKKTCQIEINKTGPEWTGIPFYI